MRYVFGGLSLLSFVLFFVLVFLATGGDYPGNVVAGVGAITCLLAAYFLNKASRRLKHT